MTLRTRLFATSLLTATLLPGLAFAQAVLRTPAAQPARVQENLRIDMERPDVGGAAVITVPDDSGKEKSLKPGATFTLKNVDLKNVSAFAPDEPKSEYANQLGQQVSLAELNAIAARITARYRNAGYILSRAVVPPQRIKGGNVTITIVEGFVNNVVVEGDNADSSLVRAYAEKIKNAKPLNSATLERYLLLMQDLPGLTARAVLRPSPTVAGASDVVITLSQKQFDGAITADNRGTRFIGPYQGGVTLNANNLMGIHERTQLRSTITSQTEELKFFQLSHDEQIGTEGTRLTVTAAHTRTEPGFRLKSFDVEGTDTLYSALVSHPFLRTRQENFFGNISFDIRNTNSDTLGQPLYADRLKVGRIGGSYD
ncbi:MAG: hypothetical protein K2Q01_07440, partial [Rickettsiales bacterium]|nr:hypothetical protein [Rickettsiales bacterium]